MKKDSNAKKWVFYFSIVAVAIMLYKLLDNFTNITNWIVGFIKVLTPFVGGIIIAYILYLPSKKIEEAFQKNKKRKFLNKHARGTSVAITYIMAVIVIVIIVNCLIPVIVQSLNDLITNIPGYYEMAIKNIESLPDDNILKSPQATEIINNIKQVDLQQFFNLEKITSYLKGALSVAYGLLDAFIAIIVSVYILCQRRTIIGFWSKVMKSIIPSDKYEKIKKYFINGNEVFFKFLTSQIIDALIVGILVSVAMLIIGVKYAVLLGFMIGLLNLIPYFGAIIGVIIALVVTALTGGLGQMLVTAVVVIVLQQIDANIINPKIVGDSLQISQLVVIFAVTVGGAYFGVLGMFIAVPIATVIKMIIEDYVNEKEKEN